MDFGIYKLFLCSTGNEGRTFQIAAGFIADVYLQWQDTVQVNRFPLMAFIKNA